MTLDEAIKHSIEKYQELKDTCKDCANEHLQVAVWLEELKEYRKGKR